jgi:hypothetical protein
LKRIIITSAAAAAITASGLALAGSAGAATSTSKVVITTKSYAHYDTTSVSGTATFDSPNGPVWAIDNLNEKWTVTPITDPGNGANYSVTLSLTTGSRFAEFADPRTAAEGSANPGGPRAGTGTVTGTIQWDVQSPTAPDLGAVPAVQQPNTSLGTVRHQIFDGNDTVVGGGHYTFTYANVAGAPYVQTG